MAGYRWIQLFFILMSGLQFTGASVFIQRGDDVTLPCENVINNQDKCDGTTWIFSDSRRSAAVSLFEHGQIHKEAKSKSDRLSVRKNCSLVIKKVTDEDVGRYTCRQFNRAGQQQGGDSVAELSVVTMTQHKDIDLVMLNCFMSTYERCRQTVKWLFDGKDVKNDDQTIKTSQSSCNTTVIFLTSHSVYSSWFELFKCEVTDDNSFQQFTFSLQPPGEKPGDKTPSATTATTATTDFSATNNIESDAASPTNPKTLEDVWWLFLIAALVLVALLILAVVGWKRTQGNKSRMNDKVESTSKPAVSQPAPEPIYNTVDPEDGVSYASVSFKKKTNSEARLHTKKDEDDESGSVTYITVKASSSEPSDLYAAIRKPKNPKSV